MVNATLVDPKDGGSMPGMWVPCMVFAHLFAAFFLLRMLNVMYPAAWPNTKAKLLGRSRRAARQAPAALQQDGEDEKGEEEAQELADMQGCSKDAGLKGARHVQDSSSSSDQQRSAAHGASSSSGRAGGSSPTGHPGRSETPYYECGPDGDVELGMGDVAHTGAADQGVLPHSQGSLALIHKLTSSLKPMLMTWEDIGCSYNTSSGLKVVLQGVWGRADPGDMVALMGPSGAGKSTMMDILAGRKSVGQLTGSVMVNGHARRKEAFRKRTAYVPQEDNFLPTMTVAETCSFYATVLLPKGTSAAVRQERIAEVLAAMGLSHTTGTLVGGTLPGGIILRGLSGGERKRLSIATGIMSKPCIVFLDEPTSGLDSFAALSVMTYMATMAREGQTVISSIHQPRAAIWALFDKTMLLSLGRMMYFGPREGLVPWFVEGCGYPYDPAMHGLASDWVMDLVNIGFRKPESLFGKMMNTPEELEAASDAFTLKYLADHGLTLPSDPAHPTAVAAAAAAAAASAANGCSSSVVGKLPGAAGSSSTGGDSAADADAHSRDQATEGGGGVEGAGPSVLSTGSASGQHHQQQQPGGLRGWFRRRVSGGGEAGGHASASWLTQCRILLWRELLSVTRNPADVAGRCLIFTWLALFVGLIFYNLPATVDGLRARMNVLFVEPVILLLLPYVYMSLFTSDKQYFIADVSAKLYRPSAYYVAKQLAVLPFAVMNSLLFTFVLYGLAGLRHDSASVGMNAIMSVLMYLIAAQVLTFTAVVMPNEDLAFMGAIAWTAVNLLLSNFMVRYVDMANHWLSYLRYLSAMGYAFDGYGQAEFAGVAYSCANGLAPSIAGFLPEFLPNTPAIRSPLVTRTINSPGPSCIVDLDSILTYFELFRPFWMTVVILLAYLGILHIATFVGLLQLTKQERR